MSDEKPAAPAPAGAPSIQQVETARIEYVQMQAPAADGSPFALLLDFVTPSGLAVQLPLSGTDLRKLIAKAEECEALLGRHRPN